MKRQALGKGLSALIPAGTIADPTVPPPPQVFDRGRQVEPKKSAADGVHRKKPKPPDTAVEFLRRDPESGAVAGPEQGSSPAGALVWLDIDRIHPNPLQPRKRFPADQIEELTSSIRSSGILQPIIVRKLDEGYGIVAGERRWRAAQRAGLHKIPALVREVTDEGLLEIALVENLQRQDLNPIEEARAYASLIEDFGLTQAEIAERVGRERSTVANSLRLLGLPEKVRGSIESGALTMGHARALLGLPGPRAQELGAEVVIGRGLSVRETEAWVTRHTEEPAPKGPHPARDPHIGSAEQTLQRHLGTRVRILEGPGKKGKIVLEYYSAAELDRLYERLSRA